MSDPRAGGARRDPRKQPTESVPVESGPRSVSTEEELRAALVHLMGVRSKLRAIEAETGLSKTTIAELRRGRRRVSEDSLTKIVSVYAPDDLAAWRAAWQRVNARPDPSAPPVPVDPPAGPALTVAHTDPATRQRLSERLHPSARKLAAVALPILLFESALLVLRALARRLLARRRAAP